MSVACFGALSDPGLIPGNASCSSSCGFCCGRSACSQRNELSALLAPSSPGCGNSLWGMWCLHEHLCVFSKVTSPWLDVRMQCVTVQAQSLVDRHLFPVLRPLVCRLTHHPAVQHWPSQAFQHFFPSFFLYFFFWTEVFREQGKKVKGKYCPPHSVKIQPRVPL